ncbi:MAG TPA: uracil-DNA glycosylase [Candidatus Hydrogenedentes bacterium]|nr:uracil-DNA glycosylase [Candidatus Hydrogenedentota bacterium]
MPKPEDIQKIVREVAALVKQEAKATRGAVTLSPEVAEWLQSVHESPVVYESPAPESGAHAPHQELADELAAIDAEVRQCTQCGLNAGRRNTVFGAGNSRADLVFVGEAPGAEEDRQGAPFVGRAGMLLTDIIVKGMKMRREDVYICNVLKCRPPENRDPSPEEVYYCEPYLLRQLEVIQPKVICALGRIAAQTLLKTTESTGKLRGRWHSYHGIPFRVTYHPAYLLRNPADKKKCWEDIQEIMKVLNGESTPDMGGGLIAQRLI